MNHRGPKSRTIGRVTLALAAAWCAAGACDANEEKPLPPFEDIRETVSRHFSMLPDYQPGDILAQSEVEPLFVQLDRMGWSVADSKTLVNRVPPDGDFLVRQLRTPEGRKFMRQISPYPGAYDSLDRMRWLPNGQRTVYNLIHQSDRGGDVIKYLRTTEDGKRAERLMGEKPTSPDYNKPTGRIYTAEMLLDRLEEGYAKAREAEEKAAADRGT
ncbi:MAG: hypothetical protein JXB62_19340 [Pirellulales bacterium]|nr:hypothetical protein [Pirellulales bacterium]